MNEASPKKRLKKGTVRKDGMVFRNYGKNYANGEYWVTPEVFEKIETKAKEWREKRKKLILPPKDKRKIGQKRHDGMVWRGFNPAYPNGEHWSTEDSYLRWLESVERSQNSHRNNPDSIQKRRDRIRKRYRDDEDFRRKQLEYNKSLEARMRQSVSRRKPEYRSKSAEVARLRRKNDAFFNVKSRLRNRIRKFLKKRSWNKVESSVKLIGATVDVVVAHFERLFKPGMSWSNMDSWHIDHVIPLSSAKTLDELHSLCHYTNLQPLWPKENMIKGSKLLNTNG